MPALERAIGVDAVVGIHLAMVGSIPPQTMAESLAFMLPAMNVVDRTELLGGMRMSAPPEAFAGVIDLARSVLAPADFQALDLGSPRAFGDRRRPGWGRDGGTGARDRRVDAARVLGRRGAGPALAARQRGRRRPHPARRRAGGDLRDRRPGAGPPRGGPVRLRRVPDRRRDPAGRGRRGGARAGRPVVPETFVPPLPGTEVRRRRCRTGRGPRPHGRRAQSTGRPDQGRAAGGARPRLHRRDQGRPRQHLGHLRRGHEDQLRDVPAVLDADVRRARPGGDEHPVPDLQRQGRGPAVPRPPQHPPRRGPASPLRTAGADGRAVPIGARAGPAPARRPERDAGDRRRTTGVRPLYWTIAEFCAGGLLPFLFADAEDERQQYPIVVQAVAAQLRQHATATTPATVRSASTARRCARSASSCRRCRQVDA